MKKSLALHKQELEQYKQAHEIKLKAQLLHTKNNAGNVTKMALIGGAAAYTGFKLIGLLFGRKKKKHKDEPQIVYVQQPNVTPQDVKVVSKTLWQTLKASLLAAILPMVTNFAKQAGTKAAENYGKLLLEKYKDQLNVEEIIKRFSKK